MLAAVRHLCQQDESLRKSLPSGWLAGSQTLAPWAEHYRSRSRDLLDDANLEGAIERLGIAVLQSASPVPDGHFAHLNQIDDINLQTRVEKRAGDLWRLVHTDEGPVLHFPRRLGDRARQALVGV